MFRIFLICSVALLTGCASIVGDQTQPVSVDAPDCKKASCTLSNSEGTYYIDSTPDTVEVNKAFGDMTVTCEKDGKTVTTIHESSANAATYGNILIGGGLGALIDGENGAGYDYPNHLINTLSCN